MLQTKLIAAALLLASARGNSGADEACPADPWEAALEDWVTAERGNLTRHGRIMSLPASQGYYVSDRIGLVPPPPPAQMQRRGPYPAAPHHAPPSGQGPPGHPYNQGGSQSHGPPPSSYQLSPQSSAAHGLSSGPSPGSYQPPPQPSVAPGGSSPQAAAAPGAQGLVRYDEWQATPPPPPGAGKIVNRPPNPYKDQFKPSYAPPPGAPIPVSDRVDSAPAPAPASPQKAVSETDLYLLRAIEKLVYRADLMEKRLRKLEDSLRYIAAGAGAEPVKPEPCAANFTRVGGGCYHVSWEAANWKGASFACRKLKGYLLELGGAERAPFLAALGDDARLAGVDFWTGGLNPGLLWIWAHSAKAVSANGTEPAIAGDGRCLALLGAERAFRGQDCALRHRYVCQRDDDTDKLSNEIERVAKSLRGGWRQPKIDLDKL